MQGGKRTSMQGEVLPVCHSRGGGCESGGGAGGGVCAEVSTATRSTAVLQDPHSFPRCL